MKLTMDGIKDRNAWEKAGIQLPGYDVEAVSEKAKKRRAGYILESAISFVSSSEGLRTDFWRRERWIGGLPAWKPLIMM